MGIKKALLFSFAGHLFFFSFFRLTVDINSADLSEKLSVAFLGSILPANELYPRQGDKAIFTPLEIPFLTGQVRKSFSNVTGFTDRLKYVEGKFPQSNLLTSSEKPLVGLGNISPPKVLNKFLVFEQKVATSEKQKAQDRYLATRPAWERVDLRLKVE